MLVTWDPLHTALLTSRTVPPTATVSFEARNGDTSCCSALCATTVSASMAQTSSPDAMLTAAFNASAFPPFCLWTTTRRASSGDRKSCLTSAVGISRLKTGRTGDILKAVVKRSSVSSVDPSLTAITSRLG